MPAKDYRKPQPLDRQVYVRYLTPEYEEIVEDARDRAMRISAVVREITKAYYKRQRPELKQARGVAAGLIRELNRIGNNINQLARMANAGMVAVPERELRQHLASLAATIAKL